ncbi:hypothetical protein TNCV_528191, partial [Trichonephila clavipes]
NSKSLDFNIKTLEEIKNEKKKKEGKRKFDMDETENLRKKLKIGVANKENKVRIFHVDIFI